jgi:hypothetical protein
MWLEMAKIGFCLLFLSIAESNVLGSSLLLITFFIRQSLFTISIQTNTTYLHPLFL